MKRWKGNGKPPSISLANQPRTCLQAEYTINQSTAALSLFFHSILLSSLILDSLDGVKFWCGWRASISVFHFYSSTFQISPFCLSTPMCLLHLHGLSSSNEVISVNLYSGITLHFASVSVICFKVKSILSDCTCTF